MKELWDVKGKKTISIHPAVPSEDNQDLLQKPGIEDVFSQIIPNSDNGDKLSVQ